MSRTNGKLENLKSQKLYLKVYDALKNYILDNHLKPGDKLPTEMEMCSTLGVSRNVLREAIKALEISGIVASRPGVGIILQEFSADFAFENLVYHLEWNSEYFLAQSLSVRRALELGFIHEAFISADANTISQLQENVEKMQAHYNKISSSTSTQAYTYGLEFCEADANFHRILYENVNNKVLTAIIHAVWAADKYYKSVIELAHLKKTIDKHQKILQALIARDEQAFSSAMYHHFNEAYKE